MNITLTVLYICNLSSTSYLIAIWTKVENVAMIELNHYADYNNIIQVTKLSSEHDHVI